MRRSTSTEKGILALAALMITVGGWMALFPSDTTIGHPAFRTKVYFSPYVQHISKNQARIYGGLAGLMGAGILFLVFYGKGK